MRALLHSLSPALRQGNGLLAQLLRAGALRCVFQPLAELREGGIYAHEALIRGPAGTPLQSPDALLAQARGEDRLHDFELLCVAQALTQRSRQATPGRLFVNISAAALAWGVGLCGAEPLANVVRHKYFTRDINQHPKKLQVLQAVRGIANIFGTTLVAEGIETSEELRALRDLDTPYGQDHLLGRSATEAREAIEPPALALPTMRRAWWKSTATWMRSWPSSPRRTSATGTTASSSPATGATWAWARASSW